MNNNENKEYSASSIKVMEGLEAVRKRPGMYVGSTDIKGLHHLVYEVMDNSVDEALAGYCSEILITLHEDGSCSVEDNGRGIPTGIHPSEGISAAEVVLTKLHAGGKFDNESYVFSGGLHGVGVSVVNALSKYLELIIYQNGKIFKQEYEKGKPLYSLKEIGISDKHGTYLRFIPDEEIFKQTVELSFNILSKRLREIAYLNGGLAITINDKRENKEERYKYDEGIVSFVKDLNKNKEVVFENIVYSKYVEKGFELEFGLQYNSGYDEEIISFVNNINTIEGGTHVSGFKSALTGACNKKAKDFKYTDVFSSEDVREGLVCVLSIKMAEPQFEGQTKAKLGNFDIKGQVQSIISDYLTSYFEENPAIIKKILMKAEMAMKAREAAKKAREMTRKKNVFESSVLPGKLSDCSSDVPAMNELFIVEGDSAGGSAKTARDRSIQAILPLRGKILNVEKAAIEKILANEEIKSLVAAIGIGLGNETVTLEDCRYHKIIIMTDADIDGSHIRTLLLTFFFRYMKPIIEIGYLYIAQPPLYKAKIGKSDSYLQNDRELFAFILNWIQSEVEIQKDGSILSFIAKKKLLDSLILVEKLFFEINKKNGILMEEIEDSLMLKIEISEQLQNNILYKELQDAFIQIEGWNGYELIYKNKTLFSIMEYSVLKLINLIKDSSKTFINIQRYKGLGEMNPDQLWETAMNPAAREILQVRIEDAEAANYWFTVLMGEDVTDRKMFIEQRAHFVKNLDI